MSVRQVTSPRAQNTRRRTAALAGFVALTAAVTGCTSSRAEDVSAQPDVDGSSSSPTPEPVSEADVRSNIRDGAKNVAVDETVTLRAVKGSFDHLEVTIGNGKKQQRLKGQMSRDKTTWTSAERLEPGLRYNVNAVAVDADGLRTKESTHFRTDDLTLDEQTFPSIAPLEGETVGVGMPVIVQFDVPVTDRASIEKHLSVETSSKQKGSWAWLSDNEAHWRPKTYWEPGTEVTVNADINSVSAGNGIFGQESRSTSFTIGDAMVSKIDVANHSMKVFRNGELLRTVAISAGKDGFATRSGTKVIMEKFRSKRMDAATTGISRDDPEYYNIEDVEYAMRVTYSGEFLHAAPWSVGSQGDDNVSHGCVGMSTADAAWLYDLSSRGDIVEVTGTDRGMEPGNGYTDWNKTFAEYKELSAL